MSNVFYGGTSSQCLCEMGREMEVALGSLALKLNSAPKSMSFIQLRTVYSGFMLFFITFYEWYIFIVGSARQHKFIISLGQKLNHSIFWPKQRKTWHISKVSKEKPVQTVVWSRWLWCLPPIPIITGPAKLMLLSRKFASLEVPGTLSTFCTVRFVLSSMASNSRWSDMKPET